MSQFVSRNQIALPIDLAGNHRLSASKSISPGVLLTFPLKTQNTPLRSNAIDLLRMQQYGIVVVFDEKLFKFRQQVCPIRHCRYLPDTVRADRRHSGEQ